MSVIELSQNTQGAELGALSVMGTSGQVSFTGGVYKAKIVAIGHMHLPKEIQDPPMKK